MYLLVKANLTHQIKDNLKKINPTGILVLEDGSFFHGHGFGFESTKTGEVCFNTSITGYQEIISDPSYAGQIINLHFRILEMLGQITMTTNLIKSGLEELFSILKFLTHQTIEL